MRTSTSQLSKYFGGIINSIPKGGLHTTIDTQKAEQIFGIKEVQSLYRVVDTLSFSVRRLSNGLSSIIVRRTLDC